MDAGARNDRAAAINEKQLESIGRSIDTASTPLIVGLL